MSEQTAIQKIEAQMVTLKSFGKSDLEKQEAVDIIVGVLAEAKEVYDEANATWNSIKEEFERMGEEYTASNQPFSVMSPEHEMKVSRAYYRKPSKTIEEDDVLAALCKYYGEDINDKSGQAWEAFKSITVANPKPRILDEAKLADALKGLNMKVPAEVIDDPEVMKPVAPVFSTKVAKMSQKDIKSHGSGTESPFVFTPSAQ